MKLKSFFKSKIKEWSNFHSPSEKGNFIVFTMPRSGSTWLMELLSTQPKTKFCSEPFYLDNPLVKKHSGIEKWEDLHDTSKLPVIERYLQRINDGELGFFNPNPFGDYYKMFTNRIVYKIIHGGEERIDWLAETLNAKVIFLIRHPLAVSISHTQVLRLEAMLNSEFSTHFTPDQIEFSNQVIKSGSLLEKVVLSWCLNNYIPLKLMNSDWIFLTYEQLVINPELVLSYLQEKLDLENLDKIKSGLIKPSLVKNLSDSDTISIIKKDESNRKFLLSKWRKKISEKEEKDLFKIISVFGIDIYEFGSNMPNEKYLLN